MILFHFRDAKCIGYDKGQNFFSVKINPETPDVMLTIDDDGSHQKKTWA
jgi:hypothetical protein